MEVKEEREKVGLKLNTQKTKIIASSPVIAWKIDRKAILSPCLFKLYAEYIMRNTGLEEAQARIKISRRNINNLKYADDIFLPLWKKAKKN